MSFCHEITIAIPVFNRIDYFPLAIESAMNQSVRCKIIVVDNHSAHDQFKDYVEGLNNPDISYYKNETNLGMIGNWNRCIELTDSKWLTILHDDDMLHHQFIENVLKIINEYPEAHSVAVNSFAGESLPENFHEPVNGSARLFELTKSFYLKRNLSPFPGVVFLKETAEAFGGFVPEEMPIPDLLFWKRLLDRGAQFFLDRILCFYRVSPLQESSSAFDSVIRKTIRFHAEMLDEVSGNPLVNRLITKKADVELIDYYYSRYESFTDLSQYKPFLKGKFFYSNNYIKRLLDKIWRNKSYKIKSTRNG